MFDTAKGRTTITIEENSNTLPHDAEVARYVWQEAARVQALHAELASYYRANSRDRRTINTLWARIEEAEYGLRALGVIL